MKRLPFLPLALLLVSTAFAQSKPSRVLAAEVRTKKSEAFPSRQIQPPAATTLLRWLEGYGSLFDQRRVLSGGQSGLVRRQKRAYGTSRCRWALSSGEFVVSWAGEAYHVRAGRPNRKFQSKL
jgi:hypothetical protein